jgi:hypothetical protein
MDRTRPATKTPIEWEAPAGARADWLMGAGATRAERGLIWAGALIGVAFVLSQWAVGQPGGWAWWQYVVAGVIAFDLVGGAVSNAAGSTKRQYFGPLSGPPTGIARLARDPVAFAALHVYPFLIVALFPGGTWAWAAATYAAMLLSVVLVDRIVPRYLQRPVAMLLFCVAVLASAIAASTPPGWGWFVVVYLAKLVLAHAVREEPYRPAPGT